MKKLNKKQEKKVNAGRYAVGERKVTVDGKLVTEVEPQQFEPLQTAAVRTVKEGDIVV